MSPVLCLVTQDTGHATAALLAKRAASLDQQRDRALEAALSPDVADDLCEGVHLLLSRLAARPGVGLQGLLYDFGRKMYVAGRMDQAQDDRDAAAQAEALVDGALAQITNLVERRATAAAS